jgi:alpha-L-fucosidase
MNVFLNQLQNYVCEFWQDWLPKQFDYIDLYLNNCHINEDQILPSRFFFYGDIVFPMNLFEEKP